MGKHFKGNLVFFIFTDSHYMVKTGWGRRVLQLSAERNARSSGSHLLQSGPCTPPGGLSGVAGAPTNGKMRNPELPAPEARGVPGAQSRAPHSPQPCKSLLSPTVPPEGAPTGKAHIHPTEAAYPGKQWGTGVLPAGSLPLCAPGCNARTWVPRNCHARRTKSVRTKAHNCVPVAATAASFSPAPAAHTGGFRAPRTIEGCTSRLGR